MQLNKQLCMQMKSMQKGHPLSAKWFFWKSNTFYVDFSFYFTWKVPCPLMIGRPFLPEKKNHIEPKDIRTKFEWFNC